MEELILKIRDMLDIFNFKEFYAGTFFGIDYKGIIATKRVMTTRYICAVLKAPKDLRDDKEVYSFINSIRGSLGKKFARFPYFKELGTYLVIECEEEQFEKLRLSELKFYDTTGLHINTILGSCFINSNSKKAIIAYTWGLFYSGSYFRLLVKILEQEGYTIIKQTKGKLTDK